MEQTELGAKEVIPVGCKKPKGGGK
jgi:hypothetical protein